MKKKLFAASISLAMAFIMMVSSSFAWYTVSTTATVGNIDVVMQGTQNIEIAKDAGSDTSPAEVTYNDGTDQTTFGSTISYTGLNATPLTMPGHIVSADEESDDVAEGAFATVKYNATGRTNGWVADDEPDYVAANAEAGGYSIYKATGVMPGDTNTYNYGYSFRMWLRTNVAGDIKLDYTQVGDANVSMKVVGTATAAEQGVATENPPTVSKGGNADGYKYKFTAVADTFYEVELFAFYEGEGLNADEIDAALTTTLSTITFTNAAITDTAGPGGVAPAPSGG